jgi:3D (Asp-Asp-Asp) domain-containing protein
MRKWLSRILLILTIVFVPGYQTVYAASQDEHANMVAPEFVFFGLTPLKQQNQLPVTTPQQNLALAKGPINPDQAIATLTNHDPSALHSSATAEETTNAGTNLFMNYTVKPGDSLYSIANMFNTDVQTLLSINFIKNSGLIHAGQVLQVPVKEAEMPQAALTGQISTVMTATLTAYTAGPESTGKQPGDPGYGITASGTTVMDGRTIAVDPEQIPLGSKVYIEGIGFRVAEDTGGAIKGNRIDVYMSNLDEAIHFGVKKGVKVYVLSTPKNRSL